MPIQDRTSGFRDSHADEISEESQDSCPYSIPAGMSQQTSKRFTKHFMAPTISASSKMALPKKKILVENSEIQNSCHSNTDQGRPISGSKDWRSTIEAEENPNGCSCDSENASSPPPAASTVSSQIQAIPVSSDIPGLEDVNGDDPNTSSLPYDPVTNYLTPRPQYLLYRPNRRLERVLNNEDSQDDNEQSVSHESDAEQMENSGNLSEEENLCILSSEEVGVKDQEDYCSETNQENENANPIDEAEESQDDGEDKDGEEGIHWKSRNFFLIIAFIVLLGGFSLYVMDSSCSSASRKLPERIACHGQYVVESIKAIRDAFQTKCLNAVVNCKKKDQNVALQVLAGYLCAVLYPRSMLDEPPSGEMDPVSAILSLCFNENFYGICRPGRNPMFVDALSVCTLNGENDKLSSEISGYRQTKEGEESSEAVEVPEVAVDDEELQEVEIDKRRDEIEHKLAEPADASEILMAVADIELVDESEVCKPDGNHLNTEMAETEDELPESAETPNVLVDHTEAARAADHIEVKPEEDHFITEHEECKEIGDENQMDVASDMQLNKPGELDLRKQQNWLLKNNVGVCAALAAIIMTTLCLFYRRKCNEVEEEKGTSIVSQDDEITSTEPLLPSHLSDEGFIGKIPPKVELQGEHKVDQARDRGDASSIYFNKAVETKDHVDPDKHHGATSSLQFSKSGEAYPVVSYRRRSKRKNATHSSMNEEVTPTSEKENSTTSHGSIYSQEKIKGHGDEIISPPLRRSSRIRKQVYSPR